MRRLVCLSLFLVGLCSVSTILLADDKAGMASFMSKFGLLDTNYNYESLRQRFDYIRWERVHPGFANWQRIEPTRGQYRWEWLDAYVRQAQAKEMQILFTVWPSTNWDQETCNKHLPWLANDWGKDPRDFSTLANRMGKPCDMVSYCAFLGKLVERFDGDGHEDMDGLLYPITHWEIGNEPDSRAFFQGSAADYVELLKTSYTTIKDVDPHAKVLVAALAMSGDEKTQGRNPGFVSDDSLFKLGAARYFDIMNIHRHGISEKIRRTLGEYEAGDKPIWITEPGPGGFKRLNLNTPAELAAFLRNEFTDGVEKVFVGGETKPDMLYKAIQVLSGTD